MNNNPPPSVSKIKNLLNRSADTLDSKVLTELAATRHRVLLQLDHIKTDTSGLATLRLHAVNMQHEFRFWLGIMIVVACCFAANQGWQHFNEDHTEVDIAILTDELPIDVYVD